MSVYPHWLESLRLSDVRGIADVAVRSTRDVTAVVEGVHRSIHASLGLPGAAQPGRTAGVTGLVYRSIDGIMRLTGAGLGASLALTESVTKRLLPEPPASREREVLLGVINGIMGDRLAADDNPLALPMTIRHRGEVINAAQLPSRKTLNGRVLVMIHGLCMTEHGWRRDNGEQEGGKAQSSERPRGESAPDLGEVLAEAFDQTPLYVRYNTGQALSDNGLELAVQLATLLSAWPVPVTEVTLLGHSMGGLVARSAVDQGQQLGHGWLRKLDRMVFLGTPHLGAPLERVGALVDSMLSATPFTRPFTLLSRSRSQGIQDLRYGHFARENPDIDDADSQPEGAAAGTSNPWPGNVKVLAIAGTRERLSRSGRSGRSGLSGRSGRSGRSGHSGRYGESVRLGRLSQTHDRARTLAGDGLVPVASALGSDQKAPQETVLPGAHRIIIPGTDHMALLTSRDVACELFYWMSDGSSKNV